MTDPDPEPASPEQEARLRRLLADARHGEPVPVDVAARLEQVLARLGEQGPDRLDPPDAVPPAGGRAPTPGSDPATRATGATDELAARRRRRGAAGLLVAAALVVVAGVGLTRHHTGLDTTSATDAGVAPGPVPRAAPGAAGSTAPKPRPSTPRAPGAGGATSQSAPPVSIAPSADGTESGNSTGGGTGHGEDRDRGAAPVPLTRGGFAREVERLHRRRIGDAPRTLAGLRSRTTDPRWVCGRGDYGVGRLVAAYYARTPTVLAFRTVRGETEVVDLLRCGTAEVLRSTTLATP